MTKATRTASWAKADGSQTVVMIEVRRGYETKIHTNYADGDNIQVTDRHEIETTAISLTSGGETFSNLHDATDYYNLPHATRPANLAAADMILAGNNIKIGISPANAPSVRAAIADATAEAECDPDWAAILERRAGIVKYEADYKATTDAMTLGGKTY